MVTEAKAPPGLVGSLLRGSLGFAAVSLAAFSVWAFGGGRLLGEAGLYVATAFVFLSLSGWVLHPLAGGPFRFFRVFVPAFIAYAAAWCAAYFGLGGARGEWAGSAAGCAAFALVAGALLGAWRAVPTAAVVLFVLHSAGYFLGDALWKSLRKEAPLTSMLGWGLLYGLGFGAGIGFVFHRLGRRT